MSLRDRLLQSEVQHLGQIIQTMSFELIVLQDFLKDEFGIKYENYRKKYTTTSDGHGRSQVQPSTPDPTKGRLSHKRVVSTPFSRTKVSQNEDDSHEQISNDGADEDNNDRENYNSTSWTSYNDDVMGEKSHKNDHYSLESDEDRVVLKDPLESEEKRGGRKRTKIWKYYDKVMLKNNKFSARCHNCLSLVSSRATRMVDHRIKCKRKNLQCTSAQLSRLRGRTNLTTTASTENETVIQMKPGGDSDNSMNDEGHLKKRQESVGRGSTLETLNDEGETNAPSQSGSEEEIIEAHKNSNKSSLGGGRNLDVIWNYFETVHVNNLKKAKCLSCGMLVSPKAGRMRQHKILCTEAMDAK